MSAARGSTETPLMRLGKRRGADGVPFLAPEEVEAGERLARDWMRGQLMPSVTQSWSGMPAGGTGGAGAGADIGDFALECRTRVARALDAAGPELAGVLVDICCFERGLEDVERARQWPRRSAKLLLKAGLSVLARHYGLVHESGGAGGATRAWRKS
ncbi:DUF6456 domain-containing protein [Aureimonas jatrophae]|uniref:DUF6456 domain-containing protein n=1 Tax=Aureimonas jatrophae TaxID=1166073 RepID=A0A1H0CNH3_9HYPH|nr:DUF6456 domain-containing protein [Aureimonas jatrophae]MBB3949311.1 hypothetical protein [Aureimonas jatrophae]SDN59394.1 hypothetical protein SAMN05192530_101388 [Aureimonas jatrophae]